MSNLVSGDSLEKGVVWSNMINNLFFEGNNCCGFGVFFFPAKLEFRVCANLSESLLQKCVYAFEFC